jgi:tetratricopeptide (TPR) repeat protein
MTPRIEQLQAFLKEEPDESFLKYALALEYVKIKKYDIAENCFVKLIKDDKNYVASYYQLGKLHEAMNALEPAAEIYKKGIKIAEKIANKKTLSELKEAYQLLIENDEGVF